MKKSKILSLLGVLAIIASLLPVTTNHAQAAELLNPGFETQGATSKEAYGWQSYQGGYQRNGIEYTGNYSIRLRNSGTSEFSGAYQRIDLNQTEIKPVVIEGYVRGSRITAAPGSHFGASIYTEIHLQDGTVAYWNSLPNFGTFNWRWVGFNTGTLPHINQPISHIFVVPILGNASGTAFFDDIKVTEMTPHQSAVTIMFDDGYDDLYTEAKPVMDSYGYVGTVAVPTAEIGDEGQMTADQLKALYAAGWEIASHTQNHVDLTTLSISNARRELSRSYNDLKMLGFNVKNFAFPYGTYNAKLLAEGSRYYRSMRPFELGDNPQGAMPFEVKVKKVINSTTPAEVVSWIEQAKTTGRWIVLSLHNIAAIGDDEYHTDPGVFADIIAAVNATGMPVVTYDRGLDLFAAPQ